MTDPAPGSLDPNTLSEDEVKAVDDFVWLMSLAEPPEVRDKYVQKFATMTGLAVEYLRSKLELRALKTPVGPEVADIRKEVPVHTD